MTSGEERLAGNELLFRNVNERIVELGHHAYLVVEKHVDPQ